MKLWQRVSLLTVLIILALGCYGVGFTSEATGLMVLGVIFELAFWFGLLQIEQPSANKVE